MARKRLRPLPTPDELAEIYATPHDHKRHIDHHLRVQATIDVALWVTEVFYEDLESAADLSCGNGAVLKNVEARKKYFGDFAPGYEFQGPIEQTIHEIPKVDLFINTETLEHVDDPDLVLVNLRAKCDRLILSTPIGAWNDSNREHVWAWSRKDIEDMLLLAGFQPFLFSCVDFTPMGMVYNFGIWACQ